MLWMAMDLVLLNKAKEKEKNKRACSLYKGLHVLKSRQKNQKDFQRASASLAHPGNRFNLIFTRIDP